MNYLNLRYLASFLYHFNAAFKFIAEQQKRIFCDFAKRHDQRKSGTSQAYRCHKNAYSFCCNFTFISILFHLILNSFWLNLISEAKLKSYVFEELVSGKDGSPYFFVQSYLNDVRPFHCRIRWNGIGIPFRHCVAVGWSIKGCLILICVHFFLN